MSQTLSAVTFSGQAVFQYINILSSGNFSFKASSANMADSFSSYAIVTNFVKKITATPNITATSEFFAVNLTVELYGDDNNPYILDAQVNLNEASTNGYIIEGDSSLSTSTGFVNHIIYFIQQGDKKIKVSTNISDVTAVVPTISVFQDRLKIYGMINPLPVNTRQPFMFFVSFYDFNSTLLENQHKHNLSFTLDPSGDLMYSYDSYGNGTSFVSLNILSEGTFKIIVSSEDAIVSETVRYHIDSTDCSVGSGPIACVSVLLFLMIVIPLTFRFTDQGIKEFKKLIYPIFYIYPWTALCYKQPVYRRTAIIFYLCTSELLSLTLIGAIYGYYDTPTMHYTGDFSHYYARELYKGGTAWALAQAVVFPMFLVNFYIIKNRKLINYSLFINLGFALLCFGADIGMTVEYCIGYSYDWTANFLIYVLFDQLFLYPIYTLICWLIMDPHLKRSLQLEKRESTSDLKELNLTPSDSKS